MIDFPEDVFTSPSIPLMKLVGLKTEEMAEQGRSSNFYMESDSTQFNFQHPSKSPVPAEERDQIRKMEMALRSKAGHHSVARLRGAMEDGKGRPLLSCVAERCKGRRQRQTTTQFCD